MIWLKKKFTKGPEFNAGQSGIHPPPPPTLRRVWGGGRAATVADVTIIQVIRVTNRRRILNPAQPSSAHPSQSQFPGAGGLPWRHDQRQRLLALSSLLGSNGARPSVA